MLWKDYNMVKWQMFEVYIQRDETETVKGNGWEN